MLHSVGGIQIFVLKYLYLLCHIVMGGINFGSLTIKITHFNGIQFMRTHVSVSGMVCVDVIVVPLFFTKVDVLMLFIGIWMPRGHDLLWDF